MNACACLADPATLANTAGGIAGAATILLGGVLSIIDGNLIYHPSTGAFGK